MGARVFAGRDGRFLVLNGTEFYRNSGQVLVSDDGGKVYCALKYSPLDRSSIRFQRSDAALAARATLQAINLVREDTRRWELELRGNEVIYKGEHYSETGNEFDPNSCVVIPLPFDRTETHLWQISPGNYLLKCFDSHAYTSHFYIKGVEAYVTDTRPINEDSGSHTEECCNQVHFFDHGEQLVICCNGDVYAGAPLKRLDPENYKFTYDAEMRTVRIVKPRPKKAVSAVDEQDAPRVGATV